MTWWQIAGAAGVILLVAALLVSRITGDHIPNDWDEDDGWDQEDWD